MHRRGRTPSTRRRRGIQTTNRSRHQIRLSPLTPHTHAPAFAPDDQMAPRPEEEAENPEADDDDVEMAPALPVPSVQHIQVITTTSTSPVSAAPPVPVMSESERQQFISAQKRSRDRKRAREAAETFGPLYVNRPFLRGFVNPNSPVYFMYSVHKTTKAAIDWLLMGKSVVIGGPPKSGKTFLQERICYEMLLRGRHLVLHWDFKALHQDLDRVSPPLRFQLFYEEYLFKTIYDGLEAQVPSYRWEDEIEQYRPGPALAVTNPADLEQLVYNFINFVGKVASSVNLTVLASIDQPEELFYRLATGDQELKTNRTPFHVLITVMYYFRRFQRGLSVTLVTSTQLIDGLIALYGGVPINHELGAHRLPIKIESPNHLQKLMKSYDTAHGPELIFVHSRVQPDEFYREYKGKFNRNYNVNLLYRLPLRRDRVNTSDLNDRIDGFVLTDFSPFMGHLALLLNSLIQNPRISPISTLFERITSGFKEGEAFIRTYVHRDSHEYAKTLLRLDFITLCRPPPPATGTNQFSVLPHNLICDLMNAEAIELSPGSLSCALDLSVASSSTTAAASNSITRRDDWYQLSSRLVSWCFREMYAGILQRFTNLNIPLSIQEFERINKVNKRSGSVKN